MSRGMRSILVKALLAVSQGQLDRNAYLALAVAEYVCSTAYRPSASQMASVRRALASLEGNGLVRSGRKHKVTWWFLTSEGRRYVNGRLTTLKLQRRNKRAADIMWVNRVAKSLFPDACALSKSGANSPSNCAGTLEMNLPTFRSLVRRAPCGGLAAHRRRPSGCQRHGMVKRAAWTLTTGRIAGNGAVPNETC
jgi:hypothetical protein